MKKILVLECQCGEDVYENDYGDDTRDGFLWCINCGRHYSKDKLEERVLPEIKHPPLKENN